MGARNGKMKKKKQKSKHQLVPPKGGKKRQNKKKKKGIKLNSKIWQTIVLSHSPREDESMLFEEGKDLINGGKVSIEMNAKTVDKKHNHPHAKMDENKKESKKDKNDKSGMTMGGMTIDFVKFKFGKKKKEEIADD